MKRWLYRIAALALALGVAPLILAFAAMALANAHGCRLDEGGVYPCLILGRDWGAALNTMFVGHWFALITLPIAAIAVVVILALALIDLIGYLRHRL